MSEADVEELPDGWKWATVADVTENVPNVKPAVEPNRKFAYVDISSIDNQTNRITSTRLVPGKDAPSRARRPICPGDVLFSNVRTYLRNVTIVPDDIAADVCSTGFTVLRANRAVDPRYLFRYVLTDEFAQLTEETSTGTHYPATSDRAVMALSISVPPLAEQRRIVAAVERLLGRVSAARDRLNRVPATLKRFRQAVLAAACSGRLTADWREANPPKEAAEKRRLRLLELRRSKLTTRGLRWREPATADADYLEDLPDGWTVFSVEELTTVITSGSRDWSKFYGRGTGTFLMAQNVRPGRLDLSFRQPVDPPAGDRDRERSQVEVGDLLVTIVGANTGDLCYVDRELSEHYVCQSVALMRPIDPKVAPYFNLYLNSPQHGRGQYDRYIYGEGRPHLSFDHLKMTAVALPPFAEQQEIVRRVGDLFAKADAIEAKLAAARRRVEGLTQAVLAKAFCGELVPTEAELARREGRDYEPAAALLDRIRADRARDVPPRRRTPRRT